VPTREHNALLFDFGANIVSIVSLVQPPRRFWDHAETPK